MSDEKPVEVRQIVSLSDTHFRRFQVRFTERGVLDDPFAMRRVWTIRDGELAEEWLVIRHEYGKRYTYALSNAPADTSHERLAWLKCVCHFNVRELLQAVMPLPQLSQEQATRLVVKHLVKCSRSTRSRLKSQRSQRGQT